MNANFTRIATILALAGAAAFSGMAQADRGFVSVTFGTPNYYGVNHPGPGYGRGPDRVGSFVDVRQDRQMDRIRDGIRSGELTSWEARELMREQRDIARLEKRFLSDGYLDRRELSRLDQELDQAARNIRVETRDAEDRDGFRPHRGYWR